MEKCILLCNLPIHTIHTPPCQEIFTKINRRTYDHIPDQSNSGSLEIQPETGGFAPVIHTPFVSSLPESGQITELYKISRFPQERQKLQRCGEDMWISVCQNIRTGFPHPFENLCGKLWNILIHIANRQRNTGYSISFRPIPTPTPQLIHTPKSNFHSLLKTYVEKWETTVRMTKWDVEK